MNNKEKHKSQSVKVVKTNRWLGLFRSDNLKPQYDFEAHFWGQIEMNGLAEKLLGTDKTNFWFKTKSERDSFVEGVRKLAKENNVGVVFSTSDGEMAKKRTIAIMTFVYKNVEYPYEMDFGYGYSADSAYYMFFEGNYSCDCNKSLFIQREVDENFPELNCGDEIKIKDFAITQKP